MEALSPREEIKLSFEKSLGSVTKILLDVTLVELLKSLDENISKINKLLTSTNDYYFETFSFVYDEKLLKSFQDAGVDDTFITDLLDKIKEGVTPDLNIDLKNIIASLQWFITDDFKSQLNLEHNPIDNYISLISKNMDFIDDSVQDMYATLSLIENSNYSNKERMLNITLFSYARTTTTCVESASKEFIKSAYQFCHLYILKKIISEKNSQKSILSLFKKEIYNAPKKGMGRVEKILEDFFNFSRFISSPSTPDSFKNSLVTFKTFIVKRNKVIHEDINDFDDYNYIIKNFNICNDFLGDTLNEFVAGNSQDNLIEDIVALCSEIAQQHNGVLEKLYSEAKTHIPL